jgi:hypothetical protein
LQPPEEHLAHKSVKMLFWFEILAATRRASSTQVGEDEEASPMTAAAMILASRV